MTQKYAALTFQNVDQFKWKRICAKVLAELGIDMSRNIGSAIMPAEASEKGVTISWVFSSDTKTLIVDLVGRKFYDPSEQKIDQKITDVVTNA